MFLIDVKLKKCVIKSLIDVLLYLILLSVNIRLTKYVIKSFLKLKGKETNLPNDHYLLRLGCRELIFQRHIQF